MRSNSPARIARALAREALAVARQGLWIHRAGPAVRGAATPGGLTVFVHGYMAWAAVFEPLAAELARVGLAAHQLHVSYPPSGTVAELAATLGRRIAATGADGPVSIVAHSLGGLIARHYIQEQGGRVDRLVCIATPHAGTRRAAPWSRLPLAREIAPGSATLARLHASRERLAGTRVCSVVAGHDMVVVPVESAALEGHEIVRLPELGHQEVLFAPVAWRHVARVLAE